MPTILDGSKTQTRRVMIPQPKFPTGIWDSMRYATGSKNWLHYASEKHFRKGVIEDFCPYGAVGDTLWIRHSWYHYVPSSTNKKNEQAWDPFTRTIRWKYSEGIVKNCEPDITAKGWKHKSGRFMPRWASIVTLQIQGRRVERVQEITESDADAEGIITITRSLRYGRLDGYGVKGTLPEDASTTRVNAYSILWDKINKERGYEWNANPFVYAISFSLL
jgi:hypothetical protein